MGLIHSTTLRWALNDRLTFNSNLRLFTAARDYWALGRASNFFRAGFLALCYCASLVLTESPDSNVGQTHIDEMGFNNSGWQMEGTKNVFVSSSAILALGIGLLGEAAISTWQIASVPVPTWSTSPIENAWAAVATGRRSRVQGRCFMCDHQTALESQPQQPRARHRSAWSASKEVRRVLAYPWTLVTLSLPFWGP